MSADWRASIAYAVYDGGAKGTRSDNHPVIEGWLDSLSKGQRDALLWVLWEKASDSPTGYEDVVGWCRDNGCPMPYGAGAWPEPMPYPYLRMYIKGTHVTDLALKDGPYE